jgi:hypothetical protein
MTKPPTHAGSPPRQRRGPRTRRADPVSRPPGARPERRHARARHMPELSPELQCKFGRDRSLLGGITSEEKLQAARKSSTATPMAGTPQRRRSRIRAVPFRKRLILRPTALRRRAQLDPDPSRQPVRVQAMQVLPGGTPRLLLISDELVGAPGCLPTTCCSSNGCATSNPQRCTAGPR